MTKFGLLPEGFHDRLPPFADAAAAVGCDVAQIAKSIKLGSGPDHPDGTAGP